MAANPTPPPVCDYEGSDYQTVFWETGQRAYEDRAERHALTHLLPPSGDLFLEIGAGAGRLTPLLNGFQRVVLLDYSRTQLQQARDRLSATPHADRYIYVAANVYQLPFISGAFDAASMIRVLHHLADAPLALQQIRRVLRPNAAFILEYANKRNLKAMLRYALGRQSWSPYTPEPVEFVALNFDFHPRTVNQWLADTGFTPTARRALSYFRIGLLKRTLPTGLLVAADALLQPTGAFALYSPSVFVRAHASANGPAAPAITTPLNLFACPHCGHAPLTNHTHYLACNCGRHWPIRDGIYNFKDPLTPEDATP